MNRRARWLALGAAVGLEVLGTRWRSGRFGGRLIVRCRAGHLYSTLWIPAVSVKSVRLAAVRLQYCPVGRHWTLVTPVRETDLSDPERTAARAHSDLPLP